MTFRLFSVILLSGLFLSSGSAFAGKEDKVLIRHTPPSEKSNGKSHIDTDEITGEGYVVLEVSLAAAISHVTQHEGDCLEDPQLALALDLESCQPLEE